MKYFPMRLNQDKNRLVEATDQDHLLHDTVTDISGDSSKLVISYSNKVDKEIALSTNNGAPIVSPITSFTLAQNNEYSYKLTLNDGNDRVVILPNAGLYPEASSTQTQVSFYKTAMDGTKGDKAFDVHIPTSSSELSIDSNKLKLTTTTTYGSNVSESSSEVVLPTPPASGTTIHSFESIPATDTIQLRIQGKNAEEWSALIPKPKIHSITANNDILRIHPMKADGTGDTPATIFMPVPTLTGSMNGNELVLQAGYKINTDTTNTDLVRISLPIPQQQTPNSVSELVGEPISGGEDYHTTLTLKQAVGGDKSVSIPMAGIWDIEASGSDLQAYVVDNQGKKSSKRIPLPKPSGIDSVEFDKVVSRPNPWSSGYDDYTLNITSGSDTKKAAVRLAKYTHYEFRTTVNNKAPITSLVEGTMERTNGQVHPTVVGYIPTLEMEVSRPMVADGNLYLNTHYVSNGNPVPETEKSIKIPMPKLEVTATTDYSWTAGERTGVNYTFSDKTTGYQNEVFVPQHGVLSAIVQDDALKVKMAHKNTGIVHDMVIPILTAAEFELPPKYLPREFQNNRTKLKVRCKGPVWTFSIEGTGVTCGVISQSGNSGFFFKSHVQIPVFNATLQRFKGWLVSLNGMAFRYQGEAIQPGDYLMGSATVDVLTLHNGYSGLMDPADWIRIR